MAKHCSIIILRHVCSIAIVVSNVAVDIVVVVVADIIVVVVFVVVVIVVVVIATNKFSPKTSDCLCSF